MTIICKAPDSPSGGRRVVYLCPECSRAMTTQLTLIVTGKTTRCKSCAAKETATNSNMKRNTSHGDTGTVLYTKWQGMFQRCKFHPSYKANRIAVCLEWYDYNVFKVWALANGYNDLLSIDREDVLNDYKPDNCQFIPMKDNSLKGLTVDAEQKRIVQEVYDSL